MRIARRLADLALAAVAIALVAGRAGRAHADPQIEKADQLFAEGKALLPSNLLQACGKFDESLRYNPAALGTLLNVALCDEKLGNIASAVARFSETRDRAKEQGLAEYVRAAEDHIAELQASVPHLTIHLTEQLPETKVLVDDRVVPLAGLGDVAVDPGERVIVVSAPDRLPFRLPLTIARAQHRAIFVPALARSAVAGTWQRGTGRLVTAAGGVAVLGGITLGVLARRNYHQERDAGRCTGPDSAPVCTPEGKRATDRARSLGNVGTIVGISGAVVTAAGLYLWLSAPDRARNDTAEPRLSVAPAVTGDGLGVVALGRF
jgi:hypothetical protein